MTNYRQLQSQLKALLEAGYTLQVSLNSKAEILAKELDRLNTIITASSEDNCYVEEAEVKGETINVLCYFDNSVSVGRLNRRIKNQERSFWVKNGAEVCQNKKGEYLVDISFLGSKGYREISSRFTESAEYINRSYSGVKDIMEHLQSCKLPLG